MHFNPVEKIRSQYCSSDLGIIRNKTGVRTAVHQLDQLVLVLTALSPD